MDAIVLAAGRGTRMGPLTQGLAKPLLPLGGRPLLWHVLDGVKDAGATRVVLVVGHEGAAVAASAESWGGLPIHVVEQREPRGTGHAVAVAAPEVHGDAFLVMADALFDGRELGALTGFGLLAARVDNPGAYGCLEVKAGRLLVLHEKSPNPPSNLVNTGCYRVPNQAIQDALDLQPSARGELEFTDVVSSWANAGEVQVSTTEAWYDVGTPWDYLTIHQELLGRYVPAGLTGSGLVEEGVHIRGDVFVAEGAIIKSGTYLEGVVHIGEGARIGPNAYIRGPTAIGAGCHVGAATEIKASILLDHANAPHHNYVGDSILASGCNLGSGTKTANLKVTPGNVRAGWRDGARLDTGRRKFGSVVGPGAKIGINCSLDPGTIIGARALIGAGRAVAGWVNDDDRLY